MSVELGIDVEIAGEIRIKQLWIGKQTLIFIDQVDKGRYSRKDQVIDFYTIGFLVFTFGIF